MKNEDIYKALNGVDDTLIENYNQGMKRRKRNRIIKITSTAACLTLAVSGAVIFGFSMNRQVPTVTEKSQTVETSLLSEIEESINQYDGDWSAEIPWDKLSNAQRYTEFSWNGEKYSSCVHKIDKEKINKNSVQNTTITGYSYDDCDGILYAGSDKGSSDEAVAHQIQAKLYSIKEISKSCALAVQFEGDTDYYVYVSYTYKPDNLGQFTDNLSLDENLYFNSVNGYKIEFSDKQKKMIADHLFADRNAVCVKDFDNHEFGSMVIEFGISIPVLGYENIYIGVTEDGYVTTNILDTGKAFYIGTENAQDFVNYIQSQIVDFDVIQNQNSVESQNEVFQASSAYEPE
ncbi:MAG: hypothetical protein ACI4GV_06865 [Acutalibacteraceae bacterium]